MLKKITQPPIFSSNEGCPISFMISLVLYRIECAERSLKLKLFLPYILNFCSQNLLAALKTFITFTHVAFLSPLIRTEYRRLRDFFQHFHPKCNINWGFRLFLSAYKPKPKNIFFGPKPAVQSPFIGK